MSTPTYEDLRTALVDWCVRTGRGYKAGAKQFELPVGQARSMYEWGRRNGLIADRSEKGKRGGQPVVQPAAPAPTAAQPPPPIPSTDPGPPEADDVDELADVPRVEYLRQRLVEHRGDVRMARRMRATNSLAQLTRVELVLRDELDRAVEEERARQRARLEEDGLTEAELVDGIVADLQDLEPKLIEYIVGRLQDLLPRRSR